MVVNKTVPFGFSGSFIICMFLIYFTKWMVCILWDSCCMLEVRFQSRTFSISSAQSWQHWRLNPARPKSFLRAVVILSQARHAVDGSIWPSVPVPRVLLRCTVGVSLIYITLSVHHTLLSWNQDKRMCSGEWSWEWNGTVWGTLSLTAESLGHWVRISLGENVP